jgi:predicted nucleic acid-binding protein
MTGPLFVDTSAWYDFCFRGAPTHDAVKTALDAPGARLVTSTYILDELCSLLLTRHGHALAAQVGEALRNQPALQVIHPTQADEAVAWRLFLDRPDKSYSLTDCVSFTLMRRFGLDTAVATDRHFSQEGFKVLPADA